MKFTPDLGCVSQAGYTNSRLKATQIQIFSTFALKQHKSSRFDPVFITNQGLPGDHRRGTGGTFPCDTHPAQRPQEAAGEFQ